MVQFMACIDKGRAKKKEKKKINNQLKNSETMYHKSCASGHPCMICPFFYDNHGVKTTERKLYERIISSKTKLKSRHATNPWFVQGG